MIRPSRRVIEVVVFDVGETLVDETRAWSEQADAAAGSVPAQFGESQRRSRSARMTGVLTRAPRLSAPSFSIATGIVLRPGS
jgi:FMN phosphatase YigB (HAD superfamily)